MQPCPLVMYEHFLQLSVRITTTIPHRVPFYPRLSIPGLSLSLPLFALNCAFSLGRTGPRSLRSQDSSSSPTFACGSAAQPRPAMVDRLRTPCPLHTRILHALLLPDFGMTHDSSGHSFFLRLCVSYCCASNGRASPRRLLFLCIHTSLIF